MFVALVLGRKTVWVNVLSVCNVCLSSSLSDLTDSLTNKMTAGQRNRENPL